MSYGLYDGDIYAYGDYPFFNLELMKLSTYYRKRREIVTLAPYFSPQMYTHFIYRQDYYSNQIYPSFNNIIYGGRAFDGDEYKPLDYNIEICKPDIRLYDKIAADINKRNNSAFSVMTRAEHLRLSMDGHTIWKDFSKQIRNDKNNFGVIIHDYNIAQIEGAYELISELVSELISNKQGHRVGMKFPVYTYTIEDLIKWLQLQPLNQFYSVVHRGLPQRESFNKLSICQDNFATMKQTTLDITYNKNYDNFITQDIVSLFTTILDLRRHNVAFLLTYDRDFFVDTEWIEVLRLFNRFLKYSQALLQNEDNKKRVIKYETFFSYMRHLAKYGCTEFKKADIQRIFQFVRENNYELFKLFYEYTGEE